MAHRFHNRTISGAALAIVMLLSSVTPTPATPGEIPPSASPLPQINDAVSNLQAGLPDGLALTPLATGELGALQRSEEPSGQMLLHLERVPLDGNERINGRDSAVGGLGPTAEGDDAAQGAHLLFVEAGEVVVSTGAGDQAYAEGESVLLPEAAPYTLQNDTFECISVLRLSATVRVGAAGVGAEEAPDLRPTCAEPGVLVGVGGTPMIEPMLLFLARVNWVPWSPEMEYAYFLDANAHPGPTGLWIESGRVNVTDQTAKPRGLASQFTEGSNLAIRSHHGYHAINLGPHPASALMIGAIPVDDSLWMRSPLVSSISGYTLAGNESWRITGNSWSEADNYSALQLSNGASTVYIDDFVGYEGDAQRCLDDAVALLMEDPIVSHVQPLVRDGAPTSDDETTRFVAQFTFTLTYSDGATEDLVKHMECRTLTPAYSVLLINAFLPASDFEAQLEELESLLDGLIL